MTIRVRCRIAFSAFFLLVLQSILLSILSGSLILDLFYMQVSLAAFWRKARGGSAFLLIECLVHTVHKWYDGRRQSMAAISRRLTLPQMVWRSS